MEKSTKNFEAACAALKINTTLPGVEGLPEMFQKPIVSFYKLIVIIKAKKAGRKLDWSNWKERKFSPWFNMAAGSGFALSGVDYEFDCTNVGSRLASCSDADAREIAKENIDLYQDIMVEND